jgi:hypothetical protein
MPNIAKALAISNGGLRTSEPRQGDEMALIHAGKVGVVLDCFGNRTSVRIPLSVFARLIRKSDARKRLIRACMRADV